MRASLLAFTFAELLRPLVKVLKLVHCPFESPLLDKGQLITSGEEAL